MMTNKISNAQIFITLMLCSNLFITSLSSNALNDNIWDSMLSIIIVFAINLIISIPIILMYKKGISLQQIFKDNVSYKIFAIIFLAYFIVVDVLSLLRFQTFQINTNNQDSPTIVLVFLVLLTAFYGAYKGIDCIGRSSIIVFLFFIIGIILCVIGLFDNIRLDYSEKFLADGNSELFSNSLLIFSRSNILPQLFILSHFSNKKIAPFYLFQILSVLILILIFFLTVVCLGRFAGTQNYPIFSLFTVSKLMPLERFDAIYTIISFMLISLKISVDIVAVKSLFKNGTRAIIFFSGLVLILSLIPNMSSFISMFDLYLIPVIILLSVPLPTICYIKGVRR